MLLIILSVVVALDNTFLHAEAGDVSGGFLIIRRKAFIVLSSFSVLLSCLSPPGAACKHGAKIRYLPSTLQTIGDQTHLWIQLKSKNAQRTAELLFLLSSSDASALGMLHDLGQMCLD